MSADNGIYILQTNNADGTGFEYRVAECQAVENIYYSPSRGYNDRIADDAMLVIYFGNCEVYNKKDAHDIANRIEDDILQSEWPILEYGISTIKIDKVFPFMSLEDANEIEDRRCNIPWKN